MIITATVTDPKNYPWAITIKVREKEGAPPHTKTISPGHFTGPATFVDTDISAEPQEVKDAVAEAWTPDVLDAFKAAFPWKEPPPPPYIDLNRSAFLFMMNKIGVTEAAVEALIDKMPDGTPEQADAKTLALIVFRNQQTFARGNQLLQMLTAAAGLTSEAVDAAWRAAERIKW